MEQHLRLAEAAQTREDESTRKKTAAVAQRRG
jgi:hypothetical protein